MKRRTTLRLLLPMSLLACDVDAPDRGEDDPDVVDFRGGDGYGGSFRLNTAKLFIEGMPLRHFDRDGDPVTYDDPNATRVVFQRIEMAAGGGVYEAMTHTIAVEQGQVKIDGVVRTPGEMLGSKWFFTLSDSTTAARPITLSITGVGIASVPGGLQLPLYNFSLNGLTKYYDNGPYSACDGLDARTADGVTLLGVDGTPVGVVNDFKVQYAATLYGNTKVSELGVVTTDAAVATLACLSGAVGKGGLWGYPPWVTSHLGRTGVQQLQAVTRAIRADFCADGTSHTADGTPIQVRDRYFNMFPDPLEATESVWGTNGSACTVTDDRLASGATYTCGSAVTDCNQNAANWVNGSPGFMWIKVDPAMTPIAVNHACNVASPIPGCSDPGIEATVCAVSPACCTTAWGPGCVSKVTALGAAADACCVDNGGPGCGDATVSACVGGYDASCTATRWDSLCAKEVELLGCGSCR